MTHWRIWLVLVHPTLSIRMVLLPMTSEYVLRNIEDTSDVIDRM